MHDAMDRRDFLKYLVGSGIVLCAGWELSVLLNACERGTDHGAKGPLDPRNVILITADTLRADYLHCYGNNRIGTPNIDKLAREGILFRNCFCQSTTTNPSHASILTSLYPKDHRVYLNTDYLPEDVRMISEYMRDAGFNTVGAVSAPHLNPEVSGFGRGFSTFISCQGPQATASQTNQNVLSWLRENSRSKFFMWLHYFDPHTPYTPPTAFGQGYYEGDPRDPRHTSMAEVAYPRRWEKNAALMEWLKGVTDIQFPIAQYMGEISYLDAQIGAVIAALYDQGVQGNTMIIFTSDHGEALGEHHIYFAHAGLYEATVRVPLIVWYPSSLQPDTIDSYVMGIDIMPTILDSCGVEVQASIRGRTLLSLVRGATEAIHDWVFCEHVANNQAMMRNKKWKYIKSLKNWRFNERFIITEGNRELYDLESDPGELNNCANDYPALEKELDEELVAWLEKTPPRRGPMAKPPVSEEVKENLRALGYTD